MLQCPLVDLVDLFWFCPPISWVILPIELCHLELSRCLLMHSHLLEGTPWTHHHRLLSYCWVPNMTFDQYLLGFHLDPQWFPYCFSCVSIISLANVVSKIIKTYRHRPDSLSLNLLYHFKWKSRPVLTAVLFTGWCSSVMSMCRIQFNCPEAPVPDPNPVPDSLDRKCYTRKSSLPPLVSGSTLPAGFPSSRAIPGADIR